MPAISTLGTDYATISAWWTAEKDNDYSGAGPILEIPAGVVDTFTTNFQFRYGTASKYTIRAQAGSECVGSISDTASIAFIDVAGFNWDFRNNNIEFQELYIKSPVFQSSGDTYNGLRFTRCVVHTQLQFVGSAPNVYGEGTVFIADAIDAVAQADPLYVRASIAFNGDNCTIIDNNASHVGGAFKNRSTAVQILTDCVLIGVNTSAYYELDSPPSPTVTNSGASDATLPGAVLTNLTTDMFINFAAGDYRIKADSAPAQLATPAGAFIAEASNISDIDTDNNIQAGQTGAVITATAFSLPISSITLGGEALTVTGTPTTTQAVVDIPLHINLEWGSTNTLQVTDSVETHDLIGVTLSAPTGWETVTLTSTPNPTTTESFYELSQTDATVGNFTAALNDILAFESQSGLTVDAQTIPVVAPPATVSGAYKWWDVSLSTWTSVSNFTINDLGAVTSGTTGGGKHTLRKVVRGVVRRVVRQV